MPALTRKKLDSMVTQRIGEIFKLDRDCRKGLISQAACDARLVWLRKRIFNVLVLGTGLQD
jgi:hypothetical protein